MKVRYSKEVDALYIVIDEGAYKTSEEIGDGTVLDFTNEGELIGISIQDASEKISKENFKKIVLQTI